MVGGMVVVYKANFLHVLSLSSVIIVVSDNNNDIKWKGENTPYSLPKRNVALFFLHTLFKDCVYIF